MLGLAARFFVALALRVLPDSSTICRANLFIFFAVKVTRRTLDLRIGVRVRASQPHIAKDLQFSDALLVGDRFLSCVSCLTPNSQSLIPKGLDC
jgi:hypothetical protein